MTSARVTERRPGVMSDDLPDGAHGIVAVLLAAAFRGALAAVAAFLLSGGLALLMWAVTPDSGASAVPLLRGSVVAVAAANFMPVSIGGVAVTLRPLLLSMILVLVLAGTVSRGRLAPTGRVQELAATVVTAIAYGVLVDLVVDAFAPSAAVGLTAAPAGLALVAMTLGMASHRTAWRSWWRTVVPGWARAGLRSAAAGACVLLAGGAIAVVAGLTLSLSEAVAVGRLSAPGLGDGFGLLLLCLAFLPNAVVAGVGYVSGVGFTVGGGSYSVLGSAPVELPAIPLLAAAPDNPGLSHLGLVLLIFPLVAAAVIGVVVVRTVRTRLLRFLAAALGSVLTGVAVSGLAHLSHGGVRSGPWAISGVPTLPAGMAIAACLGLISMAWVGVAGWGSVPWRATSRFGASGVESGDVVEAEPARSGRRIVGRPRRGLATMSGRAVGNPLAGTRAVGNPRAGAPVAADDSILSAAADRSETAAIQESASAYHDVRSCADPAADPARAFPEPTGQTDDEGPIDHDKDGFRTAG